MEALQASPLPESAEILDILNRIELEGLFFSHDKLAERQASRARYKSFCWVKLNHAFINLPLLPKYGN
jgi:hypothetical protein